MGSASNNIPIFNERPSTAELHLRILREKNPSYYLCEKLKWPLLAEFLQSNGVPTPRSRDTHLVIKIFPITSQGLSDHSTNEKARFTTFYLSFI
jgi:hypothetical protein